MGVEQKPEQGQWVSAEGAEGIAQVLMPEHAQTEDLNFLEFSEYEPYRAENRELLRRTVELLPNEGFVHLDIGAGTLLVAQEMIKLCQEMGKKGKIICVEPDRFALMKGKEKTPSVDGIEVELVQGNGEDLPLQGQIDSFSMHDAIHEVRGRKNKEKVLANAFARLKPGGRGTLNSAFTTIAMGEQENAKGYGWWIARSFRAVGGRGKKADEKLAVPDDEDDSTKIYTPEDYIDMMQEAGFVVNMTPRIVEMSPDALRAIARYPRFVQGVREEFQPKEENGKIPSVPELSHALFENVAKSLDRVWVDFELEKPLAAAA